MPEGGRRKIVVTGAGRGAGWGIAVVLGEAGHDVVVIDIDAATAESTAAEVSQQGGRGIAIVCDATDEAQVRDAFARVEEELGGLDLLVNTVAAIDPPSRVEDMSFENWQFAMKTNVDSVFLCSKHAIPLLAKSDEALIVNISSINGTRGFPYRAPYGASKAAVINLTETLAMELVDRGIRVNCLVPGGITGERARILGELYAEAGLLEELRRGGDESLPRAQPLDPRDIGRHVLFLASPAGAHVNGQALWLGSAPRMARQGLF
jgi:NAD(P)-dependent dehydrogenase (short-subunit alcohol dehydrogenase family)